MNKVILKVCRYIILLMVLSVNQRLLIADPLPPFEIGAFLCMNASCGATGMDSLLGLRLATDEINMQGGILGRKIKLNIADSFEWKDEESLTKAFNEFVAKTKTSVIFGPTGYLGAKKVSSIVNPSKTVWFLPSTAESLGIKNSFLIWPQFEPKTLIKFFSKKKPQLKTLIVTGNDQNLKSGSGSIVVEFKKLNFDLTEVALEKLDEFLASVRMGSVGQIIYNASYTDLLSYYPKLQKIFPEAMHFLLQIEDLNLDQAESKLDGLKLLAIDLPTGNFTSRYIKTYEQGPGISSMGTYQMVFKLKEIIEDLKSVEVSTLKKALLSGANSEYFRQGDLFFRRKAGRLVRIKDYSIELCDIN